MQKFTQPTRFHEVMINIMLFLDAFAKQREATINFIMPACPSVRMEQLSPHWKDFH